MSRKNEKRVIAISGRIVSDQKVSPVVESNGKNVAIIKPSQTLEDFGDQTIRTTKLISLMADIRQLSSILLKNTNGESE